MIKIEPISQPSKCIGNITLADVKAEGFVSMGAFVDAWLDLYGYWDPQQIFQPSSVRRIS